MANRLAYPKFQARDQNGRPLAGGRLHAYTAGTTTPRDTFSDASGTVANTNPVILDANGEAVVFLDGSYKLVLKTSADETLWTLDNITAGTEQHAFLQNLRIQCVAGAANRVAVITDSCTQPSLNDVISVAIPDGNGLAYRERSCAVAGGAGSVTLADGVDYWGRTSTSGSACTAFLYAIWSVANAGIVWALGGQPGLSVVPTTTTATDADFLLLEDSSTYVREATDYCACVGSLSYRCNAGDTPDNTVDSDSFRIFYGLNSLASDAETIVGVESGKAVTPAGLRACTATDARPGVVELATDAETISGADTLRAVTPAGNKAAIDARFAAPGTIGGMTPGAGLFSDLSIKGQKLQYFIFNIGNVGGVLKHAFYAADLTTLPTFVDKINGATATPTTSPTGTDSSTAMSGGGKIGSSAQSTFFFDTAAQITADLIASTAILYNNTGTDLIVSIRLSNTNINGATRNRLTLLFNNATSGAAFNLNTTNLIGGATIYVVVTALLA